MTKRSIIALVIIMSAITFYGCGDDDHDDGMPVGGAPCEGCPCNYFDVEMSTDCWITSPDHPPTFDSDTMDPIFSCGLTEAPPGTTTIEFEGPNSGCTKDCIRPMCQIISSPPCSPQPVSIGMQLQGQAQLDACQRCLELYVAELNDVLPINTPDGFTCRP